MGSWVHKILARKKQESISGEPFFLPVVAESFSLEMSVDHCSFQIYVNHLKAGSLLFFVLFFLFFFMNLTKCCVIFVFFIHQKP